jgi:hypothetical protein
MPQFGVPFKVRATKLGDPSIVYSFDSLSAAILKVKEWTGNNVHHTTIKRRAQNNADEWGYKWEVVTTQTPPEPIEDPNTGIDTSAFTFRDCVEAIFNGGRIRVTDEIPRRASVIDIIYVVMGEHSNPAQVWQRIKDNADSADLITKCYDWTFPGARQRITPITDSEGVMLLVNHLSGERARQFRVSAMKTLVRFLAGDPSLHMEIDENARRQSELPSQHPMQMIGEEVYAHPRSAKYIMHSPTMREKYIGSFYNRLVVYILSFHFQNRDYVKIGWSDEFRKRMDEHFKELPGCKIWCVYTIENARRVEQAWKNDFRAYCAPVDVQGKTKNELHCGVTLEEAEARLVELCQEQRAAAGDNREFEVMERKMMHELAMKDKELEMQRLQLQIIQAQLALHTRS